VMSSVGRWVIMLRILGGLAILQCNVNRILGPKLCLTRRVTCTFCMQTNRFEPESESLVKNA
jgi:hypothetical protein